MSVYILDKIKYQTGRSACGGVPPLSISRWQISEPQLSSRAGKRGETSALGVLPIPIRGVRESFVPLCQRAETVLRRMILFSGFAARQSRTIIIHFSVFS